MDSHLQFCIYKSLGFFSKKWKMESVINYEYALFKEEETILRGKFYTCFQNII